MIKCIKIKGKSGETLVEVMVSMVIFLLMLSIMQGAILFSNASLKKSKEIRENNVNILKGLQEAAEEKVDSDTLTFREVEADGTPRGFESFQISVELNQKQAKYKDAEDKEESITFYLYGTKTETTTEATTATTTESTGGNGQ